MPNDPFADYMARMQQGALGAPQPMVAPNPPMPMNTMPAPNPFQMLQGAFNPQPQLGQLAGPAMPQLPQIGVPMPPAGPLPGQMPDFMNMLQGGEQQIAAMAKAAAQVPLPPPPKPKPVAAPDAAQKPAVQPTQYVGQRISAMEKQLKENPKGGTADVKTRYQISNAKRLERR